MTLLLVEPGHQKKYDTEVQLVDDLFQSVANHADDEQLKTDPERLPRCVCDKLVDNEGDSDII